MDEWFKQLQTDLDEAAKASGTWLANALEDAEQSINVAVDEFAEVISPVTIEVDRYVNESLDATEDFVYQTLTPWLENAIAPINNTVTPYVQEHHTCVGCKFYDGSVYGGNMLVCGMHPYGPDDESCQDWESVWASKG